MTRDNDEQLTAAQAREVLAAARQERADACRVEIQQVLDRHGCRLDVAVVLRTNSITPQIQIVPVDG